MRKDITFEVCGKKYKFGKLYHTLNIDLLVHTSFFIEKMASFMLVQARLDDKKIEDIGWMNGNNVTIIKEAIKAQSIEESKSGGYNSTLIHQVLDVMAWDTGKNEWYPLVVYDPEKGLYDQKELDSLIEIGSATNPDFYVQLLTQVWVSRLSQKDMPSLLKKKVEDIMESLQGKMYTQVLSQKS